VVRNAASLDQTMPMNEASELNVQDVADLAVARRRRSGPSKVNGILHCCRYCVGDLLLAEITVSKAGAAKGKNAKHFATLPANIVGHRWSDQTLVQRR
jgi:hypothetical protein